MHMALEKFNLNRSFSEPDFHSNLPHFRRIVFQEFSQSQNDKPLIKQYTYHQVYDPSNNVSIATENIFISDDLQNCRNFELYKSENSLFHTKSSESIRQLLMHKRSTEFYNRTCENEKLRSQQDYSPMEVDNNDFSEDDYDTDTNAEYKSKKYLSNNIPNINSAIQHNRLRRLNDNLNQNKDSDILGWRRQKYNINKTHCFIIISAILTVIFGYIYLFSINNSQQNNELIEKIALDLNKVVHQDHVKDMVIQNLKYLHKDIKSKKILVFVGSTGVGKTYIINLIRKHFSTVDINFLLQPYLNIEKLKLSSSNHQCNFVIIDDLQFKNLSDVLSYIDKLPDKCILIVPIFNIQTVDDHFTFTVNHEYFNKIKEKFASKFSSNVDTVLFNDINRDNLKIWLEEQIRKKGLMINGEDAIISLLDEHNVENYGFKGLLAKINTLETL